MTFRYAVLIFVVLQLGQLSAELSRIKVRQDGHYVDNQGRVRIFHGFNAVNKAFPWYPQHMSNASLVKHYKEWGFNAVRLGTMWSGVEPEQGKYNETYLQVIRSQLSLLADNGMHAFLDMHQDVLSKRFGTYDGAPAWLVDILPKGRNPYPYPWKSTKPFYAGGWAKQYFTEDCCAAFQGLYDNVNHSQDMFIAFWKKVASTFKDVTSVLGYELINEPWAGDVWADPLLFLPGKAGSQNLFPMYDKIAGAIREVDNDTIIMYEPVTWGYVLNGEILGTGIDTVPGGPEFRDRSALSYHLYCWIHDGNHDPLTPFQKLACDDIQARDIISTAHGDIMRTGGGWFLTEFGGCQPDGNKNSSDTVMCNAMMEVADQHFGSWTYWDEDFFDDQGHIQWNILKPFVRTFPRATAGTPLSLYWDVDAHSMTYSYVVDPKIGAPTEVFVPPMWHPLGMVVSYSGVLTYTFDVDNHVLLFKPDSTVTKPRKVFIKVSPKAK